jgi:hypothetical protein
MLGGGGHAKALTDVVESFRDYSISLEGRIQISYIVRDTRLLSDEKLRSLVDNFGTFLLGIGQIYSPSVRKDIVRRVTEAGGEFATIISPFARVSPSCTVPVSTPAPT